MIRPRWLEPHLERVGVDDPITRLNAALEGRYRIERQLTIVGY